MPAILRNKRDQRSIRRPVAYFRELMPQVRQLNRLRAVRVRHPYFLKPRSRGGERQPLSIRRVSRVALLAARRNQLRHGSLRIHLGGVAPDFSIANFVHEDERPMPVWPSRNRLLVPLFRNAEHRPRMPAAAVDLPEPVAFLSRRLEQDPFSVGGPCRPAHVAKLRRSEES